MRNFILFLTHLLNNFFFPLKALNKSEKKALLQGELKINIERKIEKPIQDFGSTSVKLNEVIENNNKLDQKTLTEINSVKKDLTVNQIALNIENYKKIIDQSGIQSENKLSEYI